MAAAVAKLAGRLEFYDKEEFRMSRNFGLNLLLNLSRQEGIAEVHVLLGCECE